MSWPEWITLSNLGSYSHNHSFDLMPIEIDFTAYGMFTVSLLNGALPLGIQYAVFDNRIKITGAASELTSDLDCVFTFRISQSDGSIADRTFYLNLVALLAAPSWQGQQSFLGWQSNQVAQYTLTAIPPSGMLSLYDLPDPSSFIGIDRYSGVLTVDGSGIMVDTTINFRARATADISGASSIIDLSLDILAMPAAPHWLSTSASIPTFHGGDYVEIRLEAQDPFSDVIVYVLFADNINFPLKVSLDGLLHGYLPDPVEQTIYGFSVVATSMNGTSIQHFDLVVLPNIGQPPLYWITNEDLGSINEGTVVQLQIQANTASNSTIVYNVTGGMLPPHLILGSTDGILRGYCEYHAVAKTYYFDVTAILPVAIDNPAKISIIRQFKITVNKIYSDQFFGAGYYVTGDLKDSLLADIANIHVREAGTVVYDGITDVTTTPYLSIINGLVTGYSTADDLHGILQPWLHEPQLILGRSGNSTISNTQSVIYRHINDEQSLANTTITTGIFPPVVYPSSINNIRTSLMSHYPFVNQGNGTNSLLIPAINYDTGGIDHIAIANPGTGYTIPPVATIGGSGTGATVTLSLGLIRAEVVSSQSGWSVGDTVQFQISTAQRAATIEIEHTDESGTALSVSVLSPGAYIQVPTSGLFTVSRLGTSCVLRGEWGLVNPVIGNPGTGYECGVSLSLSGGEILPQWQYAYQPVIEIGHIRDKTAGDAVTILNSEPGSLWGTPWSPKFMTFEWQGLKWLGQTSFDDFSTGFDGGATLFQETESIMETVFDKNNLNFDRLTTVFDWQDPIAYDLFEVWGGTLIDSGTTIFDLYQTIFDSLKPRTYSNTLYRKNISLPVKQYGKYNPRW